MSTGDLTFSCPDTKWLCQKSVMRSVKGEGVSSISSSHQLRSSTLILNSRRTNSLRASSFEVLQAAGRHEFTDRCRWRGHRIAARLAEQAIDRLLAREADTPSNLHVRRAEAGRLSR